MVKPSSSSPMVSTSSEEIKYKGVRKRKWGKWVSEIRLPNSRERIWLGSYDTAEKAARAFDVALYCLRGPHAKFNFLDNPPNIVNGQSLTPQEIQEVASRVANSELELPSSSSTTTTTTTTRDESRVLQSDHAMITEDLTQSSQMDHNHTIDWSFLDMLDSSNNTIQDFSLYESFDNMQNDMYMPQLVASPKDDYNVDGHEGDENGGGHFSQSSYLWNF